MACWLVLGHLTATTGPGRGSSAKLLLVRLTYKLETTPGALPYLAYCHLIQGRPARACPLSLEIGSIPSTLPPRSLQVPMDSPRLRLLSNCEFLPTPNRNHLRKANSRGLSTHGPYMFPHQGGRHHRFFDMVMHFPRVPPPPGNCSFLEVMSTGPSLQAMIYMCSQHRTSPQHSCKPAETLPAHVTRIVLCSRALPF